MPSLSLNNSSHGTQQLSIFKSSQILSVSDSNTGTESLTVTNEGSPILDANLGINFLCVKVIRKLSFSDANVGSNIGALVTRWDDPRGSIPAPALSGRGLTRLPLTRSIVLSQRGIGQQLLSVFKNGVLVTGACS